MAADRPHTQPEITVSDWPLPISYKKLVALVCDEGTDLIVLSGYLTAIMDEESPLFGKAMELIAQLPALRRQYRETHQIPKLEIRIDKNFGNVVGESSNAPILAASDEETGRSLLEQVKGRLFDPLRNLPKAAASITL